MLRILTQKILYIIPTLIGACIISFALIRLIPGDPVLHLLGERGGSPELVLELKQQLGLDKSLLTQFYIFLKNTLHGDLGTSIVSKQSVSSEFWSRFPATLELTIIAMLWSLLIGIPLGVIAAIKKNTLIDYLTMGTSLIGYSMPIFWWGLIVIMFFSVNLNWFPVSGRIAVEYEVPFKTGLYLIDSWLGPDPAQSFLNSILHLVLPSFVLGTVPLALIARMTRSSMLEVLNEDFIRTAKAKGLSKFRVIFIHGFRNALIPIITTLGILVGSLLTGAVLTETIFSWPGIGRWLVKSVEARDYPVIQGGVLYLAIIIVFVNVTVDLVYYWVYPRMRSNS